VDRRDGAVGAQKDVRGLATVGTSAGETLASRSLSTMEYPYTIRSLYREHREDEAGVGPHKERKHASLELVGEVTYGKQRQEEWQVAGEPTQHLHWNVTLSSNARYHRTEGEGSAKRVIEATSVGTLRFHSPQACFDEQVSSEDGSVSEAKLVDGCTHAPTRKILCQHFGECTASYPGVNARGNEHEGGQYQPSPRQVRDEVGANDVRAMAMAESPAGIANVLYRAKPSGPVPVTHKRQGRWG